MDPKALVNDTAEQPEHKLKQDRQSNVKLA